MLSWICSPGEEGYVWKTIWYVFWTINNSTSIYSAKRYVPFQISEMLQPKEPIYDSEIWFSSNGCQHGLVRWNDYSVHTVIMASSLWSTIFLTISLAAWVLFRTVSALSSSSFEHFNLVVKQSYTRTSKRLQTHKAENVRNLSRQSFPLYLIIQSPKAYLFQDLVSCDLLKLCHYNPCLDYKRTKTIMDGTSL